MSTSFETIDYITDEQTRESAEYINDDWDDSELFNLVASNADVQVVCPWLSHASISLSEAMNTYPGSWTPEDEAALISLVNELLVNQPQEVGPIEAETEEETPMLPLEIADPEAELPLEISEDKVVSENSEDKNESSEVDVKSETANQSVPEQTIIIEAEPQLKEISADAKNLAHINVAAETPDIKNTEVAQVRAEVSESGKVASSNSGIVAMAETAMPTMDISVVDDGEKSVAVSVEVSTPASSFSEISTGESSEEVGGLEYVAADDPEAEKLVETKTVPSIDHERPQDSRVGEIAEIDDGQNLISEIEASSDSLPVGDNEENETSLEPVVLEAESIFETPEFLAVESEGDVIEESPSEFIELEYEKLENRTTDPATELLLDADRIAVTEDEIDSFDPADDDLGHGVSENNYLSIDTIEDDLEIPEAINSSEEVDEKPRFMEQAVEENSKPHDSPPFNFEEIEDSLLQLSEKIRFNDIDDNEETNNILDKIIEVPKKLAVGGENEITEAEAQEELEELFIELFSRLGVEYTPEIAESFAKLTIDHRLIEEKVKPNKPDEQDEAPQDTGTHEIITQILVGLSSIMRAMEHASAIGRSAIKLSFDCAEY